MRIEDIAIPMSREEHNARMEAIRRKGGLSRETIARMIKEKSNDERATGDNQE